MSVERSLVIIPTYNERENIRNMLDTVMGLSHQFDVLVVDDDSPDGTADLVKSSQQQYAGRVNLLERKGKLGLGTAYIAGFNWGLERDYDYFTEMDADFSHNPHDLERLHDVCASQGADVAVGSRYIPGGDVKNWSFDRVFLSKSASLYVRTITGMRVKDPTSGFVCYRREVLSTLDLAAIRFVGYAFQIEMKFKSHLAGFKIHEVPITFVDRVAGVSKMNSSIIHEAILGVLRLKWESLSSK